MFSLAMLVLVVLLIAVVGGMIAVFLLNRSR
jgi:hypothetical protein